MRAKAAKQFADALCEAADLRRRLAEARGREVCLDWLLRREQRAREEAERRADALHRDLIDALTDCP